MMSLAHRSCIGSASNFVTLRRREQREYLLQSGGLPAFVSVFSLFVSCILNKNKTFHLPIRYQFLFLCKDVELLVYRGEPINFSDFGFQKRVFTFLYELSQIMMMPSIQGKIDFFLVVRWLELVLLLILKMNR